MPRPSKFDFPSLYSITAITLATVYFCFQVEVFEEEYEHNRPISTGRLAYNFSSLNWESFDKFNVQEPFVITGRVVEALCMWMPLEPGVLPCGERPFQPVRCNSPPCMV